MLRFAGIGFRDLPQDRLGVRELPTLPGELKRLLEARIVAKGDALAFLRTVAFFEKGSRRILRLEAGLTCPGWMRRGTGSTGVVFSAETSSRDNVAVFIANGFARPGDRTIATSGDA
jgi:hypothetical protein